MRRSVRLRPLFYPRGETTKEEINFIKKDNACYQFCKKLVEGFSVARFFLSAGVDFYRLFATILA